MPTSYGTSAGLPDRDPAVYPPRAAAGSRRWREFVYSLNRRWGRLRGRLADFKPRALTEAPELAAALSVVPGLGHLWVDYKTAKPALLLTLYLALFYLWSCRIDPGEHTWPFLLMFGLHQWTVADAYIRAAARADGTRPAGRAAVKISMLCAGFLAMTYFAIHQTFMDNLGTVMVREDSYEPRFKRGDRLIFTQPTRYGRGDIVANSRGIERILALPGDTVEILDGTVHVNGKPLTGKFAPLLQNVASDPNIQGAASQVPEGAYFILFPAWNWALRGKSYVNFFMIPEEEILGRIRLRYHPEVEFY